MENKDDTRQDVDEVTEDIEESEEVAEEEESTEDDDSITVEELQEKLEAEKERADKAEAIVSRHRGKKKPKPKNINKVNKNISNDSDEKYERLSLKVDGYTDAQISTIIELGGIDKVKNDPILSKVLEEVKEQEASEKASQVKSYSKSGSKSSVSVEQLKGMSIEEMEKTLPHKDES